MVGRSRRAGLNDPGEDVMRVVYHARDTTLGRGVALSVCTGRTSHSQRPGRAGAVGMVLLTITVACGERPTTGADADDAGHIRFTATSAELESRDQRVEQDDVRILLRAEELLKDESVWNCQDDRACVDDERAGRRSLFCALYRASLDVVGEYRHRRVALQEVRFAVEDATGGREFEHRLRDFNNLSGTGLAEIKQVLQVAIARVTTRLDTPTPVF